MTTISGIDLKLVAISFNSIYVFLTMIAIGLLHRRTSKTIHFRPIVWVLLFSMFFQAIISLINRIYLQYHPDTSLYTKKKLAVFILNCIFVFVTCLGCLFIVVHKVFSSYMSYFVRRLIALFALGAIVCFVLNVVYEDIYDINTLYYLLWHFCTFMAFMLTIIFIFDNKGVFETTARIQFPFEKWMFWLLFFL